MAVGAAHGVEEDEVSGLEVLLVDGFRGCGLFIGPAGKGETDGLSVDRADEAAAIEPAVGRVASTAVRDAEKAHGSGDQLAGAVLDAGPHFAQLIEHLVPVDQESIQVIRRRSGCVVVGSGMGGGANQ